MILPMVRRQLWTIAFHTATVALVFSGWGLCVQEFAFRCRDLFLIVADWGVAIAFGPFCRRQWRRRGRP